MHITAPQPQTGALASLEVHWPEYLMETACLVIFMISACVFGVLLEHPASPLHQTVESSLLRRMLRGLAMGLTAVCIFYSPWGQQSGAHMNPAVTLTFFALGKMERWDAIFYIVFQFLGGIAGVIIASLAIGLPLRHSAVNYVVTVPGPTGLPVAFAAEVLIAFLMMSTVLAVSNSRTLHKWTPLFAGLLIAIYIVLEAPISGMSMNPARTFGSAFLAQDWTALWIYFTAPVIGMMAAGQAYRERNGVRQVFCAKMHHVHGKRCIFRCNFAALGG